MQMKPLFFHLKTLWKEVAATLNAIWTSWGERERLKYRMLVKIESQEYLWGAVIHCPNTLANFDKLWKFMPFFPSFSLRCDTT